LVIKEVQKEVHKVGNDEPVDKGGESGKIAP